MGPIEPAMSYKGSTDDVVVVSKRLRNISGKHQNLSTLSFSEGGSNLAPLPIMGESPVEERVPHFLKTVVRYIMSRCLDVEGIFRVAPPQDNLGFFFVFFFVFFCFFFFFLFFFIFFLFFFIFFFFFYFFFNIWIFSSSETNKRLYDRGEIADFNEALQGTFLLLSPTLSFLLFKNH